MAQWSHTDLSQAANAPTAASQFFGDLPRPMGCVRSDGTNAVVFTGSDNHIHQLQLSGTTWVHADLSLLAGAPDIQPLTSPTSCMRPDGVFSVAYTGRDDHVHVLQISGATGSHVDATALAQGAPKAVPVGPPTHFVRGDDVAVVVYQDASGLADASNCAANQLALTAGNWTHLNLSALTQAPINGRVKTAGYVKADNTTAVLFVAPPTIKELTLRPAGNWAASDLLNSVQAPQPSFLRWPMGFVRSDGIPSVVYADQQNFLHELAFVGDRWKATALSEAASAPPVSSTGSTGLGVGGGPTGYVRGDGVTAVVYCGSDNHVHELTLIGGQWVHTDLSLAANSTATFGYPFAYVRSDRVSSVIYQGADAHIHELALPAG